MWKAEKTTIYKNIAGPHVDAIADYYTLYINDVLISNMVWEKKSLSINEWQNFVCSECGVECCNPVGLLMMRKLGSSLLIVPYFDEMDEGFEEYDYDENTGNRYCAPHEWYEKGILIIEGEALKEFLSIMSGINMSEVKEPTKEETDLIIDWEERVRTQPKGFMNIKNRFNEAI